MKELSEDVKDIDSHLRVKPDPESAVRLVHKNFSLAWNYSIGYGNSFKSHTEDHRPDYVLMHVPNNRGNRQDVLSESSGTINFNRPMHLEHSHIMLRLYKKINVLEENMCTCLSSSNLIAVLRVLRIMHILS